MATRKRRIPAAVQEQLERRRKLTSSLAERQGAALGREARQQLQPLLRRGKPDKSAESLEALSIRFSASAAAARSALTQWAHGLWVIPSSVRITAIPQPPPVDTTKLAALRESKPYKVIRPAETKHVIPDMVTCITAWRAWEVRSVGDSPRLEALGKDHLWRPRRMMEAECDKSSVLDLMAGRRRRAPVHDAPEWDCTCGVWAFKELSGLVAALQRYQYIRVLGSVQLWGKVIETENGYRAQYAYPSELWLFDESLEELGFIYDVPVRLVKPDVHAPQ